MDAFKVAYLVSKVMVVTCRSSLHPLSPSPFATDECLQNCNLVTFFSLVDEERWGFASILVNVGFFMNQLPSQSETVPSRYLAISSSKRRGITASLPNPRHPGPRSELVWPGTIRWKTYTRSQPSHYVQCHERQRSTFRSCSIKPSSVAPRAL